MSTQGIAGLWGGYGIQNLTSSSTAWAPKMPHQELNYGHTRPAGPQTTQSWELSNQELRVGQYCSGPKNALTGTWILGPTAARANLTCLKKKPSRIPVICSNNKDHSVLVSTLANHPYHLTFFLLRSVVRWFYSRDFTLYRNERHDESRNGRSESELSFRISEILVDGTDWILKSTSQGSISTNKSHT